MQKEYEGWRLENNSSSLPSDVVEAILKAVNSNNPEFDIQQIMMQSLTQEKEQMRHIKNLSTG